ncbi:V-type proton ATPase subunit E-like [Dermacentor andersoni]|uniref:V-type proton ATPase subunit E-like n=1 Tax=Dermacentor andersoni TaxID=34620 RepID=UPI0021557290|nr:V-type proton ATPase subunit E-like [Dermacentor andersoni]
MAGRPGEIDVSKPIKHMLAFIEQEANEKVQEIDAKAEEEFNTEKGRLIQEQRILIMNSFSKKEKQVERQRKIQSSHVKNAARLRLLGAMDQHVTKVLVEAKSYLGQITSQGRHYQSFLEKLVLQGLLRIMKEDVVVICRKQDVALAKPVVDSAAKKFRDMTKLRVKVSVDPENFLPDPCFGGVVLAASGGRVILSNTLESRLELISQRMLPDIRSGLFGKNPRRKYYD